MNDVSQGRGRSEAEPTGGAASGREVGIRPSSERDRRVDPRVPGAFLAPDYYEQLAELRRAGAVHPIDDDVFLLPRYEEVRAVSRDPSGFCSSRGVLVNDPLRTAPADMSGSVLHMDPPEHADYRRLVNREFTPRGIVGLEDRIRELARGVLDTVEPGTPDDFVGSVAAPYPVQVIVELLGVEDGAREDFRRWSDAMIEAPDTDDPAVLACAAELWRFLDHHLRDRAAYPRDDLVSLLVHSQVHGRPLTHAEARLFCLSLLVAGNETTRHLVSGAVLALAEHPDQRAALGGRPVGDPDRGRGVPAVGHADPGLRPHRDGGHRRSTGTPIPEGGFVIMLYASANRDETTFGPTADRFDVTRPVDPPHLAFGFGEHLCLGAALARMEARVLLEELLATTPEWEVTGAPEWAPSSLVRGMRTLPWQRATMTG